MVYWIALLVCLALCFAVAAWSGRWAAAAIPVWYATLRKPRLTPPNALFAPVWTALYALMAFAVWRVWLHAPSPWRTVALAAFVLQLLLNLGWSWIFFARRAIGWALFELLCLWVAIAAATLLAGRLAPEAVWMMAPYWLWVSFAGLLNYGLWRLNRN